MKIDLYYAPVACSLVPYVTLTEAGADFTVKPLSLRLKHHLSEEYLKLNPKHKVPLLVIDGKNLTENTAMQLWIARTFPEARLLPEDPWDEIQAVSIMSWCGAGIHPYLTRLNNPAKVCNVPGAEEAIAESMSEIATAALHELFTLAEDMLPGGNYFFDRFTCCDAYFFWCFRRAKIFGLDLDRFRNCTAHFNRMLERDSVQKVLAYEQEVEAMFRAA